jgi:hypothetical protein
MSSEISEGRYLVPMSVLSDLVEPFYEWVPWDCDVFSVADVLAVPVGEECDVPYDDATGVRDMVVGQTSYHVARVAHLVRYPSVLDDDDYPIFSVSNVERGLHPILDGNHRYAAALVRGDEFFVLDVDGDIDEAEALFGVRETTVD